MNEREIITSLCLGRSILLHQQLDIPLEIAESCCEMYRSAAIRFQSVVKNYSGHNWFWIYREIARVESQIVRFLQLTAANHGEESEQLVINFDPPEIPPSADYWKKAENQNG